MSPSTARPSDRFIPYYIVLFFVLLISATAFFIYLSFHHYDGEVTKDAYKQGLTYNHTIAAAEAQDKLGWKSDVQFTTRGLEATVTFRLTDKHGKPVNGAVTKALFERPTVAGHDKEIMLTDDGKGTYSGTVALPFQGDWKVHVSATANGNNYQHVKELNLK